MHDTTLGAEDATQKISLRQGERVSYPAGGDGRSRKGTSGPPASIAPMCSLARAWVNRRDVIRGQQWA